MTASFPGPACVIAQYRPKPGQAAALLELVRAHVPALKRHGLITEMPTLCLESRSDGTLLEIFEWRDEAGSQAAHATPEIEALWSKMAAVAEFSTLKDLSEAAQPFPHFRSVNLD